MKPPPIDRFDQELAARVIRQVTRDPAYQRLSPYEQLEVSNVLLIMFMLRSGQTPDTVDGALDMFSKRTRQSFLSVYAARQKRAADAS